MSFSLPDPASDYGARIAAHLTNDRVVWLTTVSADGTPQPNPVWFYWDGSRFLIYSRAEAHRLQHIRRNPHVSLNFNSNASGGDIVVLSCIAEETSEAPEAATAAAYLERYRERIDSSFGGPAEFTKQYPVVLRLTPTKLRGF